MSERYILALDQGTTSTRAILFDRHLRIVSLSQKATKQSYPKDGWVEQNPEEILATTDATIAQAMDKAGLRETDIAAMDHQPTGNDHRVEQQNRGVSVPSDRLAGSKDSRSMRGARERTKIPSCPDRARARPLLLRDEDGMADPSRSESQNRGGKRRFVFRNG